MYKKSKTYIFEELFTWRLDCAEKYGDGIPRTAV